MKKMACCCGRSKAMEPVMSILRVFENIPIVGHLISSIYGCCADKDRAERAGLKATVGLACVVCNCPAEAVDEVVRYRSDKLFSTYLEPRPDWMKRFSRRTLRQLCLPASHQSATYYMDRKLQQIPLVEGWSKCQNLSIAEQLQGGIRFFDLRIMSDEKTKEIWSHHNVVACVLFKVILQQVRDFLIQNPTEIVGLYITNNGKSIDWVTVHSLVNEYIGKKLVWPEMSNSPIGDITENGKNVIVFGMPAPYTWTSLEYRWPNKPWPGELEQDLRETLDRMSGLTPVDLFWYKAEITVDAIGVTRSIGGLPSVIVAPRAEEKFEFLEDMAGAVNERVRTVLRDVSRMPFNIMSTDFCHDDFVARIIDLNENDETGVGVHVASAPSSPTSLTPLTVANNSFTTDTLDSSAPAVVVDMAMPPVTPLLEVWESSM